MFKFFVLWVSNVIKHLEVLMIKKLVFGMLLVMCVMGCAKKESSPAYSFTPPDWAIGTWSRTSANMTHTWTISSSNIKYVFTDQNGSVEMINSSIIKSDESTETNYTITYTSSNGDQTTIFTETQDATKINIGSLEYTKQ